MGWSFKIGRLWGIDIYLHATFFLLLAWIWTSRASRGGWEVGLVAVALTLLVFAVVVLHEYGHALTARRFGMPTERMTLWPFGGIASVGNLSCNPRQEIAVAIAGPAVNLVLAGLTYALLEWGLGPNLGRFTPLAGAYLWEFGVWFMWSNLILMGFNLIPAFPMDGGRVLRGLLGFKYDLVEATGKAVTVSRGLIIGLGIYGLAYGQFMLFIIAVFLWMSSAAELRQVIFEERLRRVQAGQGTGEDYLRLGLGEGLMGQVLGSMLGGQRNLSAADLWPHLRPAAPRSAPRESGPIYEAEYVDKGERPSQSAPDPLSLEK